MATSTQSGVSTLTEFIEEFNVESIKVNSFFLKEVFDRYNGEKAVMSGDSIITKYLDELRGDTHTVALSDEEFAKYQYNPKLMSFDVYGTTELWFLILLANELYSATQFNMQTLRMYKPNALSKIERIIELDKEIMDLNDDETRKELQGQE